jgi:hypothetical protein
MREAHTLSQRRDLDIAASYVCEITDSTRVGLFHSFNPIMLAPLALEGDLMYDVKRNLDPLRRCTSGVTRPGVRLHIPDSIKGSSHCRGLVRLASAPSVPVLGLGPRISASTP